MRRNIHAGLFLVTASLLFPLTAHAVPSFTRQTGLTCNQCHVTFSAVPDFTFTGKKFRLNGYRTPYVAEKIEAGEEGALTGNRLVLGIQNVFSLRFRNSLIQQTKQASDASLPDPGKGPVSSQPGTTISWFYVGGIGEHIGLWNEFYLDAVGNSSASAAPFRLSTFDEYDLKFVFNPSYDNLVGFAITTQEQEALAGFSPFRSYTMGAFQTNNSNISSAHTAYVNLAAYTLLKDRLFLSGGVQPGEDNYNFSDGMNVSAQLAYAFGNTDRNQLWYFGTVKAGNDGVPIVTRQTLNSDRQVVLSDAVAGVSALHKDAAGKTLGAYTSANTGDFVRMAHEIHYGFVDRGMSSITTATGFAFIRDTYDDGAELKQTSLGTRIRYLYDRTYGFEFAWSKYLTNDFTDSTGRVHHITKTAGDLFLGNGTGIALLYRPAMNFSFTLQAAVNTSLNQQLDDTRKVRNGWQWGISYDFFF